MLLFVCACGGAGGAVDAPSTQNATEVEAIRLVLADWHAAATTGDETRYFSYLAPDAIFLGPDESQRWSVDALRDYAVPRYGEKGFPIRALRYDALLSRDGTEAWFEEDLDTEVLGPARGTGWMTRNDEGRWRVTRYSLVLTVPEDRIREVKQLLASEPPAR
jgi:hypothetical protein